jgi:ketosteroid isomerase-like protein
MDEDRRQRVREVMKSLEADEAWLDALDPESPEWLVELQQQTLEAYRSGDLDWVLDNAHPEVEISQPAELPDARSYRGREGMIEALLDWPREWEDFRVSPKRVFAPDNEHVVVVGIHNGRSLRMGIEIEVEIVWLYTLEDGLMRRWQMFLNLDDALGAISTPVSE